ncbi:MAG: hypothetical protein Q8M09_14870 [Pseudomonadota bacterium]|nr:hypothetical protein [Pseudomonadota bacterium]MDP1905506.1 hypothetical protein [Pseudomonadota bacterium]
MKLETIVPAEDHIYQAVATVHDPRTDAGMKEAPVHDVTNQSRSRAIQLAQEWASNGYWGSVYNQRTGECVIDSGPWFNVDDSFIHARFPHQNGEHVATVWAHGTAETAANARLIAAAPDLLAACVALVSELDRLSGTSKAHFGRVWTAASLARIAIAKSKWLLP